MSRFLLRVIIIGVAIWLTTLLIPAINVTPYAEGTLPTLVSYGVVALIFAIVNSIIGTVLKVVALPLYILTLGLISFIINGLLLMITAGITSWFGFGLSVDGFWWGVLGAIVIAVINSILGGILRPQRRDRD